MSVDVLRIAKITLDWNELITGSLPKKLNGLRTLIGEIEKAGSLYALKKIYEQKANFSHLAAARRIDFSKESAHKESAQVVVEAANIYHFAKSWLKQLVDKEVLLLTPFLMNTLDNIGSACTLTVESVLLPLRVCGAKQRFSNLSDLRKLSAQQKFELLSQVAKINLAALTILSIVVPLLSSKIERRWLRLSLDTALTVGKTGAYLCAEETTSQPSPRVEEIVSQSFPRVEETMSQSFPRVEETMEGTSSAPPSD